MWYPQAPAVYADGRWQSAEETDGIARQWRQAALNALGDRHRILALVMPSTPEGIAAFVAMSGQPAPVLLLAPDAPDWPTGAVPAGTPIVIPPSHAALSADARARGWAPCVLPAANARTSAPPIPLLSTPGLVMFTSGSTSAPKPVFRTMAALCAADASRAQVLGLQRGQGVIVGTSLTHGGGVNRVLAAMQLGGPLALLPRSNHRAALAAVGLPGFAYWHVSPHYADVLSRCALTTPPVVPRFCMVANPIAQSVFDRFGERFGVPLRQMYSSSETGVITLDDRPDSDVKNDTVGRVLPGVEVRIGDHPDAPLAAGTNGRIWVRSPHAMAGYGFPPDVTRPGDIDGWWPTSDIGSVGETGDVRLAGRIDDCIRTREGQLVNLAAIAEMLRTFHDVADAAVVPLPGSAGASFGAVVETRDAVSPPILHARLSETLPAWARPRRLRVVRALPRLSSGKPDRRACQAVLGNEVS